MRKYAFVREFPNRYFGERLKRAQQVKAARPAVRPDIDRADGSLELRLQGMKSYQV
jgi:hypothetical protein